MIEIKVWILLYMKLIEAFLYWKANMTLRSNINYCCEIIQLKDEKRNCLKSKSHSAKENTHIQFDVIWVYMNRNNRTHHTHHDSIRQFFSYQLWRATTTKMRCLRLSPMRCCYHRLKLSTNNLNKFRRENLRWETRYANKY